MEIEAEIEAMKEQRTADELTGINQMTASERGK